MASTPRIRPEWEPQHLAPQDPREKQASSPQVVAMGEEREKRAASDRYAGYKKLVDRAEEVFGDAKRSSLWLSTPSADFEGDVPLRVAESHAFDEGFLSAVFEPIFIRIEHGIYT